MQHKNISFLNLTVGSNNRFRFKNDETLPSFSAQLINYDDKTTAELYATFIDNIKQNKPLLFNPLKVEATNSEKYLIKDGNTRFLVLKNTIEHILKAYEEMGTPMKIKDLKLPCEVYEVGELTPKVLGEINNIGAKEHYLNVCYDMYMAHQAGEEYNVIAKNYSAVKATEVKANVRIYQEFLRSKLAQVAFLQVLDRTGAEKLVSYNNALLFDEVYSFMGLKEDATTNMRIKAENIREIVMRQLDQIDDCLLAAFGSEVINEPAYVKFEGRACFVAVKSSVSVLQKYRARHQDLLAEQHNVRAVSEIPFGYIVCDENTLGAEPVVFRQACGEILYIVSNKFHKAIKSKVLTYNDMQNKMFELTQKAEKSIRKEWILFFISELDKPDSPLCQELDAIEEKMGYLDKDFKFLFGANPVKAYAKSAVMHDAVLYDQYYDFYVSKIERCKEVRQKVAHILTTAEEAKRELRNKNAQYAQVCAAAEDAMLTIFLVQNIDIEFQFVINKAGEPVVIFSNKELDKTDLADYISESKELTYLLDIVSVFYNTEKRTTIDGLAMIAEIYKSLENKQRESLVNDLAALLQEPYTEKRNEAIYSLCNHNTILI